MKVLRRIADSKGYITTGSDITLGGHNENNVENADVAVYTTAVGEYNCEVVRARARGIPVYERAEYLGTVSREYKKVIAVAGTHGKTTATGFCEQIFLPKDPTVHIGGTVLGEAGRVGGSEYFICEACEYKRSFLHLKPSVAVILNAELDHTDYYKDTADYLSAFQSFANNSDIVVINGDDENCSRLRLKNRVTFGLGKNNYLRAENVEKTARGHAFTLVAGGRKIGRVELGVKGEHNVYNALAAAAVAGVCGLSFEETKSGLENFGGAKRRFEHIGNFGGCNVYSDYAHHPSEIKTTVASARDAGNGKVTLVFEPHTYTRLKSLLGGFVESLSGADRIIVAPVYAAREKPLAGVSSNDLVRGLIDGGKHAVYIDSFFGIEKYLKDTVESGETVVFTGAGDIDKAARLFKDFMTCDVG